MAMAQRGVELRTLDEAWRMANAMARSQLVPKAFAGRPDDCLIAIQMGLEVGLAPLAAIQNIAVINGRPSIWGDAALAVCMACGVFDHGRFSESFVGAENSDGWTAVCRVARIGGATAEARFSVADAKRADLWGKAGPWKQYPQRMLKMRARSWALRDCFTDALRGLQVSEEVGDMVPYVESTTVPAAGVQAVKARLMSTPEPELPGVVEPEQPTEPVVTYEQVKAEYNRLDDTQKDEFKKRFALVMITDAKKLAPASLPALMAWMAKYTGGVPTE